MAVTRRFDRQMVIMTEEATKNAYQERADELGVSYGRLARKALDAYVQSGALSQDDGKE